MYDSVAGSELIAPLSTYKLTNLLGLLSLDCTFSLAFGIDLHRKRSVIIGISIRDSSIVRQTEEWLTLQIGARSCRRCKQGR